MIRMLIFLLERTSRKSVILSIIGPIVIAAVALYALWQTPESAELPQDSRKAQTTREVSIKLLGELPELDTEKRTLVLPFEHDTSLRVTNTLRETLNTSNGQYISVRDDMIQRLLNKWNYLWETDPEPVRLDDATQAMFRGGQADADYAITGRVQKVTEDEVAFELALIDVSTGKEISRHSVSSADTSPLNVPETVPAFLQSHHYIAGVLLFALLWPLSLMPVTRSVLKVEKNGFTLIALIVIAAVPIALAYPWAFVMHHSIWTTIAFIVGACLTVLWCMYVTAKVAESVKY